MRILATMTLALSISALGCGDEVASPSIPQGSSSGQSGGGTAAAQGSGGASVEAMGRGDVGGSGAPKVDLLLVVDNSASMCQEQVALAKGFETFVSGLQAMGGVDLQIGVVTPDMHCDPQNPHVHASMGQLSRRPASFFPPSCYKQVRLRCVEDADCRGLDGDRYQKTGGPCGSDSECGEGEECVLEPGGSGTCQGIWSCEGGAANVHAACIENPNGTTNTSCKRLCTSDEQCRELFDDERYVCQTLSATDNVGGCLLPPPTEGCPEALPPFLSSENLGLFPCLASVGVNQLKCFNYEQGLAAAWAALDPESPTRLETDIACAEETPCPEPNTDAWSVAATGNWGMTDASTACQDPQACREMGGTDCDVCRHVGRLECIEGRCQGPNVGFVREDAHLLIAFVSDEDDCSAEGTISEYLYDRCGILEGLIQGPGDSDKGGPLTEIATFVNRFKGLKADPSKVLIAVNTGDAVVPTPEDFAANIGPTCATCSVSGDACEVSYNIPEHAFVHACEPLSCSEGTCGDTGVSCSEDLECTNTCVSPSGQPLDFEYENAQDPRCSCVSAPASFSPAALEEGSAEERAMKLSAFYESVRACMQAQYVDSKGASYQCYSSTYICESESGVADWGSRYQQLAFAFGANGRSVNLCGEDFGAFWQAIIELIQERVVGR